MQLWLSLLVIGGVALAQSPPPPAPPPGIKTKFVGFQMSRIDRDSIYHTVGLREGDLIRSLNGKPVTRAEDLLDLPSLLDRDRRVEIKVRRGNKNVTLRYRIKTVAHRVPAKDKKQ